MLIEEVTALLGQYAYDLDLYMQNFPLKKFNWTNEAANMLGVADLGGAPPPHGPKFSQFHAVFWKILQNRILAPPPEGRRPLPTGNPGSAPGSITTKSIYLN